MKPFVPLLLLASLGLAGCGSAQTQSLSQPLAKSSAPSASHARYTLTANDQSFSIRWEKNPSAAALLEDLPSSLTLRELNGNEKFIRLGRSLPTDSAAIRMIRTGDIMLFEDNCLVIFYEDFKTDYRYTRLGRIENPSGLAAALGTGDVTVQISQEPL